MADSPRNLKCFVASAFNKGDVDAFFDEVIRPTLKDFNISARAVNRIVHNKNIDQKIIELIEESDLMIADLTYARPSVYFEAGYAESKIPVIYTSRDDHFRQRDSDPNGNECIHFDLTKKNIIPWNASSLPSARKKLTKRIAHVARPLFRRLAKDRLQDERTTTFAGLSQKKKLEQIYKRLSASLMQRKYHLEDVRERDSYLFAQYSRIVRRNIIVLNCSLRPIMSKKYFSSLKFAMDLGNIGFPDRYRSGGNKTIKPKNTKRVILVWMEISLRKVQPKVLQDVFSTFDISDDGKRVYSSEPAVSSSIPIPYYAHICLVDGMQNDLLFDRSVQSMIASVESGCV